MTHVLPDLLRLGLRLIVCGTGAGVESARVGHYYAGRGNKFWKTLYSVGLTPRLLQPSEFTQLVDFGIGLTDISKATAGADTVIRKNDFDRERLRQLILELQPRVLAFNGKRAAKAFLELDVTYGRYSDVIGKTIIVVAPSTSGAANAYWDLSIWREVAKLTTI